MSSLVQHAVVEFDSGGGGEGVCHGNVNAWFISIIIYYFSPSARLSHIIFFFSFFPTLKLIGGVCCSSEVCDFFTSLIPRSVGRTIELRVNFRIFRNVSGTSQALGEGSISSARYLHILG